MDGRGSSTDTIRIEVNDNYLCSFRRDKVRSRNWIQSRNQFRCDPTTSTSLGNKPHYIKFPNDVVSDSEITETGKRVNEGITDFGELKKRVNYVCHFF